MAHGDAREGKWRRNLRMEWVASTLHTTSERGVSSITSADAHNSAASSRLNWRPRRFKWTPPFRRKTKSDFCACAITFQLACTKNVASDREDPQYQINMFVIYIWLVTTCFGWNCPPSSHTEWQDAYRGADKSFVRPTSRCILIDGVNISFDASLVIYINSTNIPPIMILNRIYEHQNLLSL
jgi:hypothetical protein